VTSGLS
jgi:hypothetical protein